MDFRQLTDQAILAIATPIMDELMLASTEINHSLHTKHFTDRLKTIVTADYFENVCKHYQVEKGFFTERSPVSVFKRPDSAAIIWRQGFSKKPGDYVAEMVLVKSGDQYLVDHVMVF
ncbi:hypothetical protein HR060_09775 [Catenovulum sp. SM1970]|uniref:hypothetical protein n=1 Tax=Marinifaba aquimaris TaxID=2741323 RepID=UPI001574CCC2|nr:hypothetical protein [Marinifaba aquimaris]NTS77151.1 hypothetical protein [Marinifaba aquimaris]